MDIGTAIKTIRKEKGISQKKLAEMVGISVNSLCQIEISEEDIPDEKKAVFKSLNTAIKTILID